MERMQQALDNHHDITIRPTLLSQLGLVVALLLSTVWTWYSISELPWSVQPLDLGVGTVPLPLFAIVPLVLAACVVHNIFNFKYVLRSEYILEIEGLYSLNLKSSRLLYQHIRGVEVEQTLLDRFLDVGDVAAESDIVMPMGVIRLANVRHPLAVKNLIQERVQRALHEKELARAAA